MSISKISVTSTNSGAPFWGIVDGSGNISTESGRLMIFKTRKEARNRICSVTGGTVRKIYVSYQVRTEGGA